MTDLRAAAARADTPGTPATPSAASAAPAASAASAASARPGRRRVRYGVVAAVLVAAMALLVTRIGGSLDYFETVDQAVAQKATLGGKTVRLEGVVAPGSIQRTAHGVDFVATGAKHTVAVENTGNPPQLFQPGIPVVVVGHFAGSVFVSDQILVDHSATYIEQHPARVRAPDGSIR